MWRDTGYFFPQTAPLAPVLGEAGDLQGQGWASTAGQPHVRVGVGTAPWRWGPMAEP